MGSETDGGKKMMILAKAGEPRSGGDLGALKPVSRGPGRGEASPERFDVHELVTQRILEKLEAGTVPWVRAASEAQKVADHVLGASPAPRRD